MPQFWDGKNYAWSQYLIDLHRITVCKQDMGTRSEVRVRPYDVILVARQDYLQLQQSV